jgi:general secretion pathway protein D
VQVPLPVLSPRSQAPITLDFTDQNLSRIFEALSKLSGVNILLDRDFADSLVSVRLSGVSFEQALEQITFVNRLFFKVLNQNTVIIVPETAQKRRMYDENLLQTFYLQSADVNETVGLITKLAGIQKVAGNEALGSVTVIGTPDEIAAVGKIIEANDKARGEVVVEIQILEVNRDAVKAFGIELSNYEVDATFSPTGQEGEVDSGFTNVRAHVLSSLNLADFIVSIPSSVFARFLQTDSNVRILASPKLRAAEGQQTQLRVGTEVPIPQTTFTATQAGAQTFAPATSFTYRNVGVTVDLTPSVSASGEITLELVAEFSLIGDDRNVGTGSNPLIVPTFLTRSVTGTLRVRDGETSLLGGLVLRREADTLRGALGLQDVPVIGGLFRSNRKQVQDQEVILSITPHIVRAPRVTEEDMTSLYVGREKIEVPGARPPLFGSPEEEPTAEEPTAEETAAEETASEAVGVGVDTVADESSEEPAAETDASEAAGGAAVEEEPPADPGSPAEQGGSSDGSELSERLRTRSAARALFRPSELGVVVGEGRDVDLVVLSAPDFAVAELVLAYDGAVAEADRIVPGPLLTLGGESVGVESSLASGQVRATFRRASGASGSGGVATLRLRGLAEGSTALEVVSLTLVSPTGERVDVPAAAGRVVVAAP